MKGFEIVRITDGLDRDRTSEFLTHPRVAKKKMVTRKIRRLPVVEKGRLVGIVTERDLFKWVIRVLYEPNIPKRIKRFLK